MQYTEYLGLKKPESTDFYDIDDFNTNADSIDNRFKNLSNVDNTADFDKPMSNPQKIYLNSVIEPMKEDLNNVASTSNRAMNNISNHLSDKSNPHGVKKSDVGLDKVDNTSDMEKPISAATQTALNEIESKLTTSNTATGEHITVTNSAEASVREFKVDGRTEQFTTTGKNLLPNTARSTTTNGVTFTVNDDKSITVNGTATNGVDFFVGTDLQIGAGQYIVSGCPSGGDYGKYNIQLNADGAWNANNYDIGNGRTIDVTQSISQVAIVISKGVTVNNLVFKPMIRKAEITDGTYEPYTNGASPNPDYPQDIVGVGNNGNVEVTVTGKNLCRGYKVGCYVASDGQYSAYATDYKCTELIEVNEGVNYIESNGLGIKVNGVYFFDKNKKWISKESSQSAINNRPTGTKYIAFNYLTTEDLKWVQLELGAVATEYEPYKSQTVSIPSYSMLSEFPLYEGDSVTLKNGKLEYTRKMEMEVFDGSSDENWERGSTTTSGKYLFKISMSGLSNTSPKIYSDKLKAVTFTELWNCNNGIAFQDNSYITIYFDTIANMNVIDFKTWLSQNPITVVYELAEPSIETMATDIDLSTYSNVTNITNSDGANMEVEYFVNSANGEVALDLKKEIDELDRKKANTTDISRLDREKADISDLNDYIVADCLMKNGMSLNGNSVNSFEVDLVKKDGYVPLFWKVETNNMNVFCGKTELDGYKLTSYLKNLSSETAEFSIFVTVIYVRDI